MLTIQNYKKLKNVLFQTGYHVSDVKPVVLTNTKTLENTHWYFIEITNREQTMLVQLDRTGFDTGSRRLKLYELKLGQNYINLNRYELMDMNIVVDKINKLILEQYVS